MQLSRKLPPEMVYACGVLIFSYSTTGKYDKTDSATVSAVELLRRYMEDKIVPFKALTKKDKQ